MVDLFPEATEGRGGIKGGGGQFRKGSTGSGCGIHGFPRTLHVNMNENTIARGPRWGKGPGDGISEIRSRQARRTSPLRLTRFRKYSGKFSSLRRRLRSLLRAAF